MKAEKNAFQLVLRNKRNFRFHLLVSQRVVSLPFSSFQKNHQKESGLALQLQKILESFISNQWENLNNSFVTKECLWKPRSKSLALDDFCADHARLEAKEDDGSK